MSTLDELLAPPKTTGLAFYHYTTPEGLLGIVDSRTLWTTSILHLNDSTEFNYAISLAYQQLVMKAANSTEEKHKKFYSGLLDSLVGLREFTLFVGSFSEMPDSLSQWRAYSRGGFGFNIGFKDRYIQSLAQRQRYQLCKCVYDPARQNEIISAMVESLDPQRDRISEATKFFEQLIVIAPMLKDSAFQDEQEWRIVSEVSFAAIPNDAEFRPGKSMLIPYKKFNLADENGLIQVHDICAGPNPHPELSHFSLLSMSDEQEVNNFGDSCFSNSLSVLVAG